MWRNIFKLRFLRNVIMFLVSAYTFSRFFKIPRRLKPEEKQIQLFRARHNCVVMYSDKRMTGWPNPNPPVNKKNFVLIERCDPILYFIKTASRSLDVALMVTNISAITNALIKAHKRGVKVRVLVDYTYGKCTLVKDLEDSGIEILYYIRQKPSDGSIMNSTYMVKDYSNGAGYLCIGSSNWTVCSIQQYYQNILFTTSPSEVRGFHESFKKNLEVHQ